MARVTKADQFKRCRARIEHAQKWRKEQGYDALWRRLIDMYRGKQYPKSVTDEDRIAVNIAFATINVIAPSVSINHPKITVLANKAEDEDKATMIEAIHDYQWRHYKFLEPVQEAVKDALILGFGVTKATWKFVEKEQQVSPNDYQASFDEANDQADQFAAANPDLANVVPSPDEIAANLPDTTLVIVEDRPTVERVSPADMFFDPLAVRLNDGSCGWIAQRIVRSLDEAKNDSRYKRSVRKDLKGDTALADNMDTRQSDRKRRDGDVMYVTIWEYYDLSSSTLSVFADSGDDYLIDPTPIPYSFGHPFTLFRDYDVPDQFYPMGELEAIESLQEELNKTRSMMMNARKRYARKHIYRERAFGVEGRAALQSNVDGTMVPVTDDMTPLNDLVLPIPQNPVDPEMYRWSEMVEQDADRVSGVTEFMRGSGDNAGSPNKSATEAAIIQDAANSRAADKLAMVERGIAEISSKVIALTQQYMTGEAVARVIGPNAQGFWFNYKREDLVGEYDFQVEAGSTQPINDSSRRQTALAMLTALGPFLGQVVDPVQVVKYALQYGFGIKNPDKFLVQQAPPQQSPSERIIESINYKDVPPDIQRQMEQQAGFDPSQMGMAAAQALPGGQQGPPQGGPPQQGAPQQMQPQQGPPGQNPMPLNGQGQPIPPQILDQLHSQVGLSIGSMAGSQKGGRNGR